MRATLLTHRANVTQVTKDGNMQKGCALTHLRKTVCPTVGGVARPTLRI